MVTRRGFLKAAAWAGEALSVATIGGAWELAHQAYPYYDQTLADSLKDGIGDCIAFARAHNLTPIMQSAAYHSGIPLAELMTLTYFESSMGQNLNAHYVAGSPPQSAQGIVQATAEKFRELVAYYLINPAQDAIAPIKQCLDNPYDANAQKLLAATVYAKSLVDEIRDSFKTAVQSPTTPAIIGDHKILDEYILAGRDSPHASMVLVGKGLMRICHEHPNLSSLLTGAEFRMLHMFGPDGTHQIIKLNKSNPNMTMAQAFRDPNGAAHSHDYILENNYIPAATTVGDFVKLFRTQHDTVCKMLADYCYENKLKPALLQNAALIPPAISQPRLPNLTNINAKAQRPPHDAHHVKPEHHLHHR